LSAQTWTLAWDRGAAEVSALAGALGPASFTLPNGRTVQPFAVAPWSDDTDPRHAALPGVLRRLRGEWACVPFGMPEPLSGLPPSWRPAPSDEQRYAEHFHGYSSNAEWSLASRAHGEIELVLTYHEDHPVRRVTRRLAGIAGRPAIEVTLGIEMRRETELPLGVHPTFRLPETPGAARIRFDGEVTVHTYPVAPAPGISRLVTDISGVPLTAVPAMGGRTIDLSRHPLDAPTEELVLASGHGGGATLENLEDAYAVRLTWDAGVFPSCNIWIANGGHQAYPWNGRFRALGLEPVVAPFDLGTAVARSMNPLRASGIPTSRRLKAGHALTTTYRIEVFAL
jgi:hypothetical protein